MLLHLEFVTNADFSNSAIFCKVGWYVYKNGASVGLTVDGRTKDGIYTAPNIVRRECHYNHEYFLF